MLNMLAKRTALITLVAALVPVSAFAHGPSRLKISKEVVVNAPAEAVWEMISDFCSIETWHPAVVSCEGEGGNDKGATRVLTIGEEGGPTISEKLLKFDPDRMMYKYKIEETDDSVLPVTQYASFLSVSDNGDGTSTVKWRSGFYRAYMKNEPPPELSDEAARTAVTGVYEAGLDSIKAMAEK